MMVEFVQNAWQFISANWAVILVLLYPQAKKVAVAMKEFVEMMRSLAQETHKILKNHDETLKEHHQRIAELEKKALQA